MLKSLKNSGPGKNIVECYKIYFKVIELIKTTTMYVDSFTRPAFNKQTQQTNKSTIK